jgi:hypothetical protein
MRSCPFNPIITRAKSLPQRRLFFIGNATRTNELLSYVYASMPLHDPRG